MILLMHDWGMTHQHGSTGLENVHRKMSNNLRAQYAEDYVYIVHSMISSFSPILDTAMITLNQAQQKIHKL